MMHHGIYFTRQLGVWAVCFALYPCANLATLDAATLTRLAETNVKHEYMPASGNHLPAFAGGAFLRLQGNLGASPSIDALSLVGTLVGIRFRRRARCARDRGQCLFARGRWNAGSRRLVGVVRRSQRAVHSRDRQRRLQPPCSYRPVRCGGDGCGR